MTRVWAHFRSQAVGYVALFVALGGTALAALPANSVGTTQLQNGAVTGQKVAKHTLTGANINVSTLGTVPNSAHLGGLPASGWQRLVSASCAGGNAIAKIDADGTVACQPTGTGTLTGVSGSTDSGITGGGTSGSVTLGIDPTIIQHRLASGCPSGQAITAVAQDGTPACQAFGSGNGTITSVGVGTGLSGGGSSGQVSLSLATGYQLPQTCSANQLVRWSGTAWGCANDGGLTSWQLGGNAGTAPASDYLGTSDSQPLNLKTNGIQALELQPPGDTAFEPGSPNLIGGFSGNNVSSGVSGATIAGGGGSSEANTVTADFGTVGGGVNNTAGSLATVAGGQGNFATGMWSTAAGAANNASGTASTALGQANVAAGTNSVALGESATDGSSFGNSFVWSDGTLGASSQRFAVTAAKQFDALASGGFTMQLSAPAATFTGCTLTSSSGWACSSDRNVKHAFRPISDRAILQSLARMPIDSWAYKLDRKGTRHIGPTAQAFLAAFHVGNNPRLIGTLDEGGVALAGDQGLYRLLLHQQTEIVALRAQLATLEHSPHCCSPR